MAGAVGVQAPLLLGDLLEALSLQGGPPSLVWVQQRPQRPLQGVTWQRRSLQS